MGLRLEDRVPGLAHPELVRIARAGLLACSGPCARHDELIHGLWRSCTSEQEAPSGWNTRWPGR
jgi:hypothetical protein